MWHGDFDAEGLISNYHKPVKLLHIFFFSCPQRPKNLGWIRPLNGSHASVVQTGNWSLKRRIFGKCRQPSKHTATSWFPPGRWRTIATLLKGANGRLRRQRPFEKKSSKETLLGCYHLILHQIEGRHLLPSSSFTVYTGPGGSSVVLNITVS